MSEIEYPVEARSARQCVFEVQLRGGIRAKVKVSIGDNGEVIAYINGIRSVIEEWVPNKPRQGTEGKIPSPSIELETFRP